MMQKRNTKTFNMKRVLFFFSIIVYFSLVLVACKSKQPLEPVTIETTKVITQIERDTIFKKEADSSFYFAYVDCVNGKPVLREPQPKQDSAAPKSKAGKNLEVPKVNLTGNKLEVNCEQKAQELFLKWKETHTQEKEKITVPVYIEKEFKWYHQGLMWIGGIAILLIGIGITLKFTKL